MSTYIHIPLLQVPLAPAVGRGPVPRLLRRRRLLLLPRRGRRGGDGGPGGADAGREGLHLLAQLRGVRALQLVGHGLGAWSSEWVV